MATKVTLTIEGGLEEVGAVLDAARGVSGVKVVGVDTQQERTPAAPKDKPAKAAKPRKPRGKNGAAKGAKAAPAPKPEPEPEEPDEAEEVEVAENDSDFSVDPSHDGLQNARRLREVVQHILDQGFEDQDEIVAVCEEIKDEVPLLQRVQNIPDRVGKAYNMLSK